MDVQVNYLAVLLAMLSSLVIGAVWYSPKTFAPIWVKLARIDTTKDRGSIMKPMIITVIVSLLTAYVLAHVTYLSNQFFGHSYLQDALSTAFWTWLGFTAARFITHDAFEGRPMALTALNIGNEFVTLMVMGLVIGLMGV